MVNFFRKVRKQFADANKPLKYMRYAIGEIVLVVIGILIALSINNWNEDRLERRQEKALLKQLKTEFSMNLVQLDDKIAVKTELINSVLRLFQYIDHPGLRNKDSIEYHIGRTFPFSTFDPIVNDLASSGSLRLIRSDSLKLLLSLWTSDIKDVKEDDLSWKEYRNEYYVPFLVANYQLRTIRQKAIDSGVLEKYLIDAKDKEAPATYEAIGASQYKVDFNKLFDQPDFEDHLERAITTNRFALSQSLILRNRIQEILDILENQLQDNH
jgi:hypothetical protein